MEPVTRREGATTPPAVRSERIVVGIDFQPPSIEAAKWTARHLAPEAELILTHVIAVPQPPAFIERRFPIAEETLESARRGAAVRLRELGDSLPATRKRLEVRDGRATTALADVAKETGAGLIVLGEHTRRPGLIDRISTTAERLLRDADVPVLVVRNPPDHPPRHVLVCIDDSPAGDVLLDHATAFCGEHGAHLTVLHVLDATLAGYMSMVTSVAGPDHIVDQMRDDARAWLETKLARVCPGAEARIEFGWPAEEAARIVEEIRADLVIAGSQSAQHAGRRLLGSVARAILAASPCSVLVIARV